MCVAVSLCLSVCLYFSVRLFVFLSQIIHPTSNTNLVLLGQQPSDLGIALGEIGPGQGLPVLAAVDLDVQMSDGHGHMGQMYCQINLCNGRIMHHTLISALAAKECMN